MSWNGSNNQKVERRGGQRNLLSSTSTINFNYKALIASLAVVLVGGLAAWLVLGRARTPSAPQSDVPAAPSSRIAEAAPAPAPKPAGRVVKPKRTKEEMDAASIRAAEAQFGDNMPPGLKTLVYYKKNPPKQIYSAPISYPYLKHTSERDLACVLLVQPGTEFLEPMTYGQDFDDDFIAALTDPIETKADDTDEVKREKELIRQLKKEMAALVKETGKKPSELMSEQSKLMFEMGRFERQLAEDLAAAEDNPDLTDQDVRDMFEAANVLRKKKGLEEHEVPDLTLRTVQLKRRQRQELREKLKQQQKEKESK